MLKSSIENLESKIKTKYNQIRQNKTVNNKVTCLGAVGLSQQVSERFHQVSCEQDEESFEPLGDAVGQPAESQQTLFAVGFTPVEQLQEKQGLRSASGRNHACFTGARVPHVTLKKSGLNVTSDSFITMARRQSITPPSISAVFSSSPCARQTRSVTTCSSKDREEEGGGELNEEGNVFVEHAGSSGLT